MYLGGGGGGGGLKNKRKKKQLFIYDNAGIFLMSLIERLIVVTLHFQKMG